MSSLLQRTAGRLSRSEVTKPAVVAGWCAIGASLVVLVGWVSGLGNLKSIAPGLPPMVPATALSLILAGTSLRFIAESGPRASERKQRLVGRALAGGVVFYGTLTLGEYIFGVDFGIAGLRFWTFAEGTPTQLMRPSPHTAISLVLLGMALLLLNIRHWTTIAAQVLAFTVAALSLLVLLGYAYGTAALYALSSRTGMAVHTALVFGILAGGILSLDRKEGFAAILRSPAPGGVLARRLLPGAIGIPVLLGWLRLQGEKSGLYDKEIGVALSVMTTIVLLTALILVVSKSIDRAEAGRRIVEATLRESEQKFRALTQTAREAIITADRNGNIVYINHGAEKMFGYAAKEITGESLTVLMPERYRDPHREGLQRYLKTGQGRVLGRTVELSAIRRDQTEFPVELSLSSWQSGGEVFFTGIIREITDRKRAEEEIRLRSKQLETANRELEAFAYSVSHDLRAPLRSIHGFSQALLHDFAPNLGDTGRNYIDRVCRATERMSMLIDDLLNLSRVTRADIHRQPVDLSMLARTVATDLAETQPDRDVKFIIAEGLVTQADPRLLRVVIENLLENAWKFTSKHPTASITVGVEHRGDKRVYFVRDDGAGFDTAYAKKLFGAFQRLHSEREFPGTGIGLATVQRIIARHGGDVWAEGRIEEGATFYFTL